MTARRRGLRVDLRVVLGALLIMVSVIGVWVVLQASQRTSAVYVAKAALVPGEVIRASDVERVDVVLGDRTDHYLSGEQLPEGATATAVVRPGELVPRGSVGSATDVSTTTIVIPSASAVPAAIGKGSRVEVWAVPVVEDKTQAKPQIIVGDATVQRVVQEAGVMRQGATNIEVVVPRSAVPAILTALANKSSVSVIPAGAE